MKPDARPASSASSRLRAAGLAAFLAVGLASLPNAAAARRIAPAHWVKVASFQGEVTGNTKPFTVSGPWRVVWHTRGKASQQLLMHAAMVGKSGASRVADARGSAHGIGPVTRATGTYYLHIQTDEPYGVTVEALERTRPPQPSYRWKPVMSVHAQGLLTGQLFTVKAPWRVVWTTTHSTTLLVDVDVPGQQETVDRLGSVAGRRGTAYEYMSGTFYLVVTGATSYKVTVEQGSR